MNTASEMSSDCQATGVSPSPTPSVDFIQAISEFFETDPSDLLFELGYYSREDEEALASSTASAATTL